MKICYREGLSLTDTCDSKFFSFEVAASRRRKNMKK